MNHYPKDEIEELNRIQEELKVRSSETEFETDAVLKGLAAEVYVDLSRLLLLDTDTPREKEALTYEDNNPDSIQPQNH